MPAQDDAHRAPLTDATVTQQRRRAVATQHHAGNRISGVSCMLIPMSASRSWHWILLAERVRTHGRQVVTVDLLVNDDAAGLADDRQTTSAQSSTPSADLSGGSC